MKNIGVSTRMMAKATQMTTLMTVLTISKMKEKIIRIKHSLWKDVSNRRTATATQMTMSTTGKRKERSIRTFSLKDL